MNTEKLEKLHELREKGILTEEEYQQEKAKVLAGEDSRVRTSYWHSNNEKEYAMFIHLSMFAGLIIPVMGLILPLVLWLVKRDDTYIDQQGRVVANWIISFLIYSFVSVILVAILIGWLLLAALVICHIIFVILGSIRAKDGIIKDYPFTIKFFRIEESDT